jgi:TfoX/Sxy family transcriptional regulator of competence genes
MQFRPSPQEVVALFERVAPTGPDITRRKMFGFPAAFVNGNLCCGTFNDQLMLRLPEDARAEQETLGGLPFAPMPGRPMKGYVAVAPQVFADEATLRAWLERAATFTRTLPAKR